MTYRLPMVALGRLIATAAVGQCWVWLVATGTFGLFLVALVIHHRREAQTLLRREAEPGLGEQRPVITVSRLQAIARVCGLCVMALGALVLASWQVGNQTPKVIAHGVAPMNLPAVLAFILAGAALFFQTPRRTGTWRRLPQAAALAVAFIGLLRISDCFGWNPHLEQVMFRGVLAGNHMSPNAAACFLLAGLALAMLDTSGLRRRRFANGLALGGIAIAAAALVGYVFDAGNLYKIGDYPTALISDVALAMLFLGTLCARPENEIIARLTSVSIGGVMLRTLLPASIGIPIVLGGLRLLGQRMGLYGTEVGITLSTLSTIIILLIVVWWNAGLLHGLDIRRRQIQTAIIKTRDDLSRRVEERTAELTEANASLQRQIAVRQQREEELALGQKRANTLLRLTEMTDSPLQDITDLALESAVEFTKSQIGYLAFLNDDETILTMHSWSKTAMERCRMENKPLVYPVATTGLWGEAVRQRKAVITNDYAAANPLKKGTPHGHVEIKRHMNVPIFEDKHLMAVIGVANKEEPYDDQDEVLLRLLMNEAGRVIEHQRADEEIRQLNAELERQVVQRTAQYEFADKELESFSYSVAHDLRAPLRAIDGFSRILVEEHKAALPQEAQGHLKRVRDQVHHMSIMVDGLLSMSHLGRQQIVRRVVTPTTLVAEVMESFSSELQGRDVQVRIGILPECMADPAMLKLVFANLLANALKFTRACQAAVIEVGSLHKDSQDVLFVKDNGVGFDMRYAGKLFGVFQRLHRADQYEGPGIGLAIAQRIIQRHGGRIWAESSPGAGATFYFTLGGDAAST